MNGFLLCLQSEAAVPAKPPAVGLLADQPKLLHLASGEFFPFILDAANGNRAEVLLESSAPGIEFLVVAPDGRQLQTATPEYPGWIALSFPIAESGEYRVVAHTAPFREGMGSAAVRVSISSLSPVRAESSMKAEQLFASAQSLSRSANAADLRQAIVNETQAGAAWAAAGDRKGQVLALAAEAQAWVGLSEHEKAIAALTRATTLCAPTSFWYAWLTDREAQVFLDRWDNELAKKKTEEALRLSVGLQDAWLDADVLADRGGVEYLTHTSTAKTVIDESVQRARENDAIATLARALRYNAWSEKDQGHLARSFVALDQARGYFHQDGDIRSEMQVMATLSTIAIATGDPYVSVLRHTKLAELIRQSGSTANYAILLENLGADYAALNRLTDAILYYQQALAAYRSTHHASGEAIVLSVLCSTEMRQNRLPDALRDCQMSSAIFEKLHDPKRIAISTYRLGKVRQSLGQTALAIDNFRQAEALSESVHDTRFAAQALLDWGDALDGLGKQEEAQQLFQKALGFSLAAEEVSLLVEARYRLAHSMFETGHDDDAKRTLDLALDKITTLRRSVGNADLQASYFAQVRKCHDLYVDILMSEQQRDPSLSSAARALAISESGRALTLLDALAARDADAPAEHATSVSYEMAGLHFAVEHAYDQRLKLMIEGARKSELEANAAKLTQAIDSLERAEDEMRASGRPQAPAGRTLSAAQIADASKKSHSTLVEYALGTDRSYVWVIDEGTIESHILPGRAEITALVKRWRELATARTGRAGDDFNQTPKRIEAADKELPAVAAHLSCMLLGPFLRPGMDHLVIVPDGELHLLPFAALPEDGCTGGKEPIVVARHLVLTPSLSILLTRPQQERPATYRGVVTVFADPVFDRDDSRVLKTADASTGKGHALFAPALPRLRATGDEAEEIRKLVKPDSIALHKGFDANLQSLLSPSLGDYRILHLATHGVLDEVVPGFSGIVLSLVGPDGQPVFGYLKAHDIESLHLRSDLVVLSSCDSAAGANLSGEGVTGLTHAFLSAGTRRVISTLWSIDDDVTSTKIMKSLYTGMLSDGLDPAEALRRSQVQALRDPDTAAPYYWASFHITSITE